MAVHACMHAPAAGYCAVSAASWYRNHDGSDWLPIFKAGQTTCVTQLGKPLRTIELKLNLLSTVIAFTLPPRRYTVCGTRQTCLTVDKHYAKYRYYKNKMEILSAVYDTDGVTHTCWHITSRTTMHNTLCCCCCCIYHCCCCCCIMLHQPLLYPSKHCFTIAIRM